jgi:hypothetical protein
MRRAGRVLHGDNSLLQFRLYWPCRFLWPFLASLGDLKSTFTYRFVNEFTFSSSLEDCNLRAEIGIRNVQAADTLWCCSRWILCQHYPEMENSRRGELFKPSGIQNQASAVVPRRSIRYILQSSILWYVETEVVKSDKTASWPTGERVFCVISPTQRKRAPPSVDMIGRWAERYPTLNLKVPWLYFFSGPNQKNKV